MFCKIKFCKFFFNLSHTDWRLHLLSLCFIILWYYLLSFLRGFPSASRLNVHRYDTDIIPLILAVKCERSMEQSDWRALREDSRTHWERLSRIPVRLLRSIILIGPQRTQNHSAVSIRHEMWNEGSLKVDLHYLYGLGVCFQSARRFFGVFMCAEKQRETETEGGKQEKEKRGGMISGNECEWEMDQKLINGVLPISPPMSINREH